jgi:hypothetical protein
MLERDQVQTEIMIAPILIRSVIVPHSLIMIMPTMPKVTILITKGPTLIELLMMIAIIKTSMIKPLALKSLTIINMTNQIRIKPITKRQVLRNNIQIVRPSKRDNKIILVKELVQALIPIISTLILRKVLLVPPIKIMMRLIEMITSTQRDLTLTEVQIMLVLII